MVKSDMRFSTMSPLLQKVVRKSGEFGEATFSLSSLVTACAMPESVVKANLVLAVRAGWVLQRGDDYYQCKLDKYELLMPSSPKTAASVPERLPLAQSSNDLADENNALREQVAQLQQENSALKARLDKIAALASQ